jgi:glucosamine kinase
MTVLVGIDVGASKVEVRLRRIGGHAAQDRVLRHRTGAWQSLTWGEKAQKIVDWIDDAETSAPLSVGVGAHGCDSAEACEALHAEIGRRSDAPVRVVSDAELLAYAVGQPTAISVIAGTGCIAVARDAGGGVVLGGGQGWLVGDDGGATGIVREAVRGAIRARESGEPDPVLERELSHALAQSEFAGVSLHLMLTRPAEWARAAPAVFAAVAAGSPVADRIIAHAVEYVHDIVRSVVRRGAVGRHVVLGGGVFASQADYRQRVEQRLRSNPDLTVEYVLDPPSSGALRLAASVVTAP